MGRKILEKKQVPSARYNRSRLQDFEKVVEKLKGWNPASETLDVVKKTISFV